MTEIEESTLKRISDGLVEPLSAMMSVVKHSDKEIMEWIIASNIAEIAVVYVRVGVVKKMIAEKLFLDSSLTIKGVLTKDKGVQTIHIIKQRRPETKLTGWKTKKTEGSVIKLSEYYNTNFN